MAELGMDYDPDTVERGSFDGELVPAGTRAPMQIVQSEVIPTKNGKGKMLKLRWDITEGPFTNRVIFDQINYQHESQQAQTIGQQQLKAICEAVGHTGPLNDSEVLHYRPIMGTVGIEKGSPKDDGTNYPDKNVIKGYKSLSGSAPPATKAPTQSAVPAQQRQASPPPPPAAGAPARPWPSRAA